jgi:DNA-binding response OmpR family regulator
MRILIVDDADAIRRMIEALVSSRSYEVETAASGTKALDMAMANVPDVVLLDLNMPGTHDGFAVCRALRESELTRGVTIIVITAMDDAESRARAFAAGASAYYTKPFSPMALLKELDAVRVRHNSTPKLPPS